MSSNQRIGKLEQAINLTAKPTNQEEKNNYNKNFSKGVSLFNQLCSAATLTPDDKLDIIVAYSKSVPDEAKDMICRWRDMIPFLRDKDLEDMIILLCKIARCPDLSSHERVITAVTLYNNAFLDVCYSCFSDIACDRSVLVDYRVDACRYLFGSQDDEYKQLAQESLLEIIDTDQYPSDYRYKIIAGFITNTGISTMLNFTKLKIPYDESFVYGLQTNFFYNDINGVRERILSGQYLMQIPSSDAEEKNDVGEVLLHFAESNDLTENARADAADVVFRLGTHSQKIKAREIIVGLGYSTVDNKGFGLSRTKTMYTNSQNIHQFQTQIDTFIEKIINETSVSVRPFHEIHNEVSDYIRSNVKEKDKRFRAFKALNRISVDTARFTNYNVTLAEIFVHVWIRILNYDNDKQEELKNRMAEELMDMGDTCSSGHSGRFINVLSDYDITLKISWNEQIKSNMVGRMLARIRDCPDAEMRSQLAMAESELAEEEDKEVYKKFIEDNLKSLKEELRKEFVGEGYITSQEFEDSFDEGAKKWL